VAAGGGVSTAALDLIKGALGPQVLADAAERLGEEPAAVSLFVTAGAPAVLGRLMERGTASSGAEALLGAMRRMGAARALADPLSRLEPGGQPDPDLVGEGLSDRLGRYAGVGEGSAAALTAMLTPLVLGAVARIAPTPLTPDTLARTLREQEAGVARALPLGFDAAETSAPTPAAAPTPAPAAPTEPVAVPFLEPVADTAPPQPIPVVQPPAAVPDATPAKNSGGGGGATRWLLIAVAVLLVLALLAVLLGNLSAADARDSPAEPSGTRAPAAAGREE
jgi:hypothetical protein